MTRLPEDVPLDLVVESQDSMASMFIHALLTFEGHADAGRMERAVRLLASRVPILACGVMQGGAMSWTWAPARALDEMFRCETFDAAAGAEQAIRELVAGDPPSATPPLLRALLARAPDRDRVALKFSHLVSDAGGIKELVYLLAETYRELGLDAGWDPGPAELGPRGVRQILAPLGPRDWLRLLRASVREDRAMLGSGSVIPLVPEDRGQPAYVDVYLGRDLVEALKRHGDARGAKLNDQLIAGFVRAQARLGNPGDRFVVPFTVDLRRYLDSKQVIISNVSSITNIAVPRAEVGTFDEALQCVCAETRYYKSHFIGLAGTARAMLVTALVPAGLRRRLLSWLWCAVSDRGMIGPAFTNLGVLDQRKAHFGDVELARASVAAPIGRSGRMICSASGFAGTITMHLGCQDGGDPEGSVARLGRYWREELELAGVSRGVRGRAAPDRSLL